MNHHQSHHFFGSQSTTPWRHFSATAGCFWAPDQFWLPGGNAAASDVAVRWLGNSGTVAPNGSAFNREHIREYMGNIIVPLAP